MRTMAEIIRKHLGNGTASKPYDLQERVDRFNLKQGDLPGYNCPICRNKGVVMEVRGDKEHLTECGCIGIRFALQSSGLSRMIEEKRFDNYHAEEPWQKAIKQTAQDYADHPDGWMLFCGQSGSGKTHLCTASAGELIRRGVPVMYMLWREDIVRLKASVSDYAQYQSIMMPLKNARCLYIDDLFKGNITPADVNVAFELIDYRYRSNLPTIISTEKSPGELEKIDEAVAGRIIERCRGRLAWISDDGKRNYRIVEKGAG